MSGKTIQEIVARNIVYYRKQRGLSQEKLSKACGLGVRFISRAENSPQNLTLATLEVIARALGVTVAELSGENGGKKVGKPSKKTIDALDETIRVLQAYRAMME